jgi:S1-C subfamily serine protease
MSQPAPPNIMQQLSDAFSTVAIQAKLRIVAVHSARSRSSGFIWRPGLIVTADEGLAEDAGISIVQCGGTTAAATLVGRDPTTDVALLRTDTFSAPDQVLQSATAALGALTLVIGSQNGAPTVASGIVSFVGGAWRSLRGGAVDARVELDVSLRRTSEGGLALDASACAFGMVVFGPRGKVLVIPAATIDRVADKLQTHGKIAHGYLGLGIQEVRLNSADGIGVMVMSVDPKGPGAAAGARMGDVIIKWNGEPIRGVRMLLRELGPDSIGSAIKLSLLRGGEPAEVHLTISERPEG